MTPEPRPTSYGSPSPSLRLEALLFGGTFLLGILPRIAMVSAFPTQPISDFASLVEFALELKRDLFASGAWGWKNFSSGLPTALSLLFLVFPQDPESAARWSTALVTGLTPLLPLWIWRGVFPLPARLAAAGLLALWPDQILFSGVVAQDNWILPIGVGLGAMAVRSQVTGRGHPWVSGILLGAGAWVRQEMLLALIPLALASGLGRWKSSWTRPMLAMAAAATGVLGLAAVQRGIATGRFTVTSEHGGLAVLGAYSPGSGTDYWVDPSPFLAAEAPELLATIESGRDIGGRAMALAANEFLERPTYHLVRMAAGTLNGLLRTGLGSLYWSLTGPGVLPGPMAGTADRMKAFVEPLLLWGPVVFWGTFLFLVVWALHRTAAARTGVLALLVAMGLKLLIHAVITPQPRYYFVVAAWVILALAVGLDALMTTGWSRAATRWLVVSAAAAATLQPALVRAEAYLLRNNEPPAPPYSFPLRDEGLTFTCTMTEGRLTGAWEETVAAVLSRDDPNPGDLARVACRSAPAATESTLRILAYDSYGLGGYPGRILQLVYADGKAILEHDIGAAEDVGWIESRPITIPPGHSLELILEIRAVAPEPGWGWGSAGATSFQLVIEGGEPP